MISRCGGGIDTEVVKPDTVGKKQGQARNSWHL